MTDLEDLYYCFWKMLLYKEKRKTNLHANISPGRAQWIGATRSGMQLNFAVRKRDCYIELWLGTDRQHAAIFDTLYRARHDIEKAFGELLEWRHGGGKKAWRVVYSIDIGGIHDLDKWPEMQNALIDSMIRFERGLGPYL